MAETELVTKFIRELSLVIIGGAFERGLIDAPLPSPQSSIRTNSPGNNGEVFLPSRQLRHSLKFVLIIESFQSQGTMGMEMLHV